MKKISFIIILLGMFAAAFPVYAKEIVFREPKLENFYPRSFHEGLAVVSFSSYEIFGYMNAEGELVIPMIYAYAANFEDGWAKVMLGDKYGFIDKTGAYIIPPEYDALYYFKEDGYADAVKDGVQGRVDKNGVFEPFTAAPPLYVHKGQYYEGLAAAAIKGEFGRLYGYIDEAGETVIPFIYDNASDFSEGIGIVVKDGVWKYINHNGEQAVPGEYQGAWRFQDGLAVVKKDGYCGVINMDGETVIPFKYHSCWGFAKGMFMLCRYNRWFVLDYTGKNILPEGTYIYDYRFLNGDKINRFMLINNDGKFGFIDRFGEVIIPFIYDFVGDFKEGICLVVKDGKYGYISLDGETVIPFIYDDAQWHWSNGYANVKQDGLWGTIDMEGNMIIPIIYDDIYSVIEGVAVVVKDGLNGLADAENGGEPLLPAEYEMVDYPNGGAGWIYTDGKYIIYEIIE